MKVIFHERIGIQMEGELPLVLRQVGKIGLKIRPVEEDALSLISPGDHVVEGAGKMNSGFPRHEEAIAKEKIPVNTLLL
jgi:hypothetical protein